MRKISIRCLKLKDRHIVPLPGSKSESNRALLINALCSQPGDVNNLAIARDTEIMQQLLRQKNGDYNARDAGTVMRFMTAYLAVTKEEAEITGSERMKMRPISILVEALIKLGANITYLEKEGYPPLKISSIKAQATDTLTIESTVSSQYISALLMIGPTLPAGLNLILDGNPVSQPYIDMTLSIMQHFEVNVDVSGQSYHVSKQEYKYHPFSVEADWSGASYWYSIFALSDIPTLNITGLKSDSAQGDSILKELMMDFGVKTEFNGDKAILSRVPHKLPNKIDFIECPDLAQTIAVLCAALGHECDFLGLQTLKIKETDRIIALKNELNKFGADFIEGDNRWTVFPIPSTELNKQSSIEINTYDDHRMAMAFAPLGLKRELIFDDPAVVNKSYPTFWDDLDSAGFIIKEIS